MYAYLESALCVITVAYIVANIFYLIVTFYHFAHVHFSPSSISLKNHRSRKQQRMAQAGQPRRRYESQHLIVSYERYLTSPPAPWPFTYVILSLAESDAWLTRDGGLCFRWPQPGLTDAQSSSSVLRRKSKAPAGLDDAARDWAISGGGFDSRVLLWGQGHREQGMGVPEWVRKDWDYSILTQGNAKSISNGQWHVKSD